MGVAWKDCKTIEIVINQPKGINHNFQGNFLKQGTGTMTFPAQASGDDLLLSYWSREGEAKEVGMPLLRDPNPALLHWEGPGLVSFDSGGSLTLSQHLAHHGHGIGTVC